MEEQDTIAIGQTLPELTTELLSAYTTQSSEIKLKEEFLQKLDSELVGLEVQLQIVAGDVCTTVRTICLREDSLAKLGRECQSLEREVLTLVQQRQDLQLNLQEVKRKKGLDEEVQRSYESKMKCHEDKTKELEKLSSAQIELETLKEKILTLKAKSG